MVANGWAVVERLSTEEVIEEAREGGLEGCLRKTD